MTREAIDARTSSQGGWLLGVLHEMAARTSDPVSIAMAGIGRVDIDVASRRFHADVSDWDAFCAGRAPDYALHAIDRLHSDGRPWHELLWIVGYHGSRGTLLNGLSRYAPVRLPTCWRPLPRISSREPT